MAKRGPKPKPTKLLELRGSWRARTRTGEPQPAIEAPTCPAWLSAHAKTVWRQLIPVLQGMGLVSQADRLALSRYCQLYGRWRAIEGWLADHLGESGYTHMAFVANGLQKELSTIEGTFGMSPQARAALGLALSKHRGQADTAAKTKDRFFTVG